MTRPKKKRRVTVLLPLTTAAEVLGVKYDTLVTAAKQDRLPVSYAKSQVGGYLQPLLSARDLETFSRRQRAVYRGRESDYHRDLVRRIADGAKSLADATLDQVLRPRTSRNGRG